MATDRGREIHMNAVRSSDGTTIAYDKVGDGPALILIDGALCHREFGPAGALAELLAPHFTVYTYDRRGRGQSGDTEPYSVDREIEDIAALVEEAGGSAFAYGISSGAALALDAAARTPGIQKVATYEPPFVVDPDANTIPHDFIPRLREHLDAGAPAKAVEQFMGQVGAPKIMVKAMRLMPAWKKLKAAASTLPYDFTILGETGSGRALPRERWAGVTVPVLAMAGGKSPEYMRQSSEQLAEILADARYRTLEGQTHMLKAKAVAPVLVEFFGTKTTAGAAPAGNAVAA